MKETDFRKHPAIADSDLIGAGLCSLPDLGELTMIRVGRESSERLKSLGIHVSGANYDSNFVLLHRDSRNVQTSNVHVH